MKSTEYPSVLKARVMELLANRPMPLTLNKIAEDTGLTHAFLASLVQGVPNDPGVSKIERLFVYLSGKPLDL